MLLSIRLNLILVHKVAGAHDAEADKTDKADDDGQVVVNRNLTGAEKYVAYCQIEQGPQYVNHRTGKTFARRFGKRRRKGITRNAIDKMGYKIGQKGAGPKAAEIMIPLHNKEILA